MNDLTSPPSSNLTIERLAPGSLIPDPRNTRELKAPHIAEVARSISTFGVVAPVIVDADNIIMAGHVRVAAALKLGLSEIPVVRAAHLSAEQRQAYAIADNRLTETGRWNERILGEVLRDLSVANLNFDLDVIGFSVGEIDFKVAALNDAAADDADRLDLLPPLSDGPAVTQSGDLWLAGGHRILCGDARDKENWIRLMNGQAAAMSISDPPYNLNVDGFISGLGKVQHREFACASGEMDRDEFTAFLTVVFLLIAAYLAPGSLAYLFMDHRHMGEMLAAGESAFSELKTLCAWVKPSGAMGGLYRNRMELVFVWKAGRGRNRNNVQLGRYGRNRTNVWEYPGIAGFRHSEGGDLLKIHPTCKPVQLCADAMLDVTARGDIVIDPFLGSGTTVIAAERIGRVAYGMEIDPIYMDAILRRYEMLTGTSPVLEATGETFAEVAAQRQQQVEG